jgi:hypothetical protein
VVAVVKAVFETTIATSLEVHAVSIDRGNDLLRFFLNGLDRRTQ